MLTLLLILLPFGAATNIFIFDNGLSLLPLLLSYVKTLISACLSNLVSICVLVVFKIRLNI